MQYQGEMCHPHNANGESNFRRGISDLRAAALGGALISIFLLSCGSDVFFTSDRGPRQPSVGEPPFTGEPPEQDRDAGHEWKSDAGNHGRCLEQPWALVFDFALGADGSLSQTGMDFLPTSRVRLTTSVSSVAQGAPGSENLLAASLISADGVVLSRVLFDAPRFADAGVRMSPDRDFIELALQLAPDTQRLVITNWNTGAVLLDLDLHGDLQLLCLNQPCLDLCANPDAGSLQVMDSGADLTGTVSD